MESDHKNEEIFFNNRKDIIVLEMERDKKRHQFKLVELEKERQNIILFHEKEIERILLKSKEIRNRYSRVDD